MQPTGAVGAASNPGQEQSPLSVDAGQGHIANVIPDGAVASPRGIPCSVCQRNHSSSFELSFAGASEVSVPASERYEVIGHGDRVADGHLDPRQEPVDHFGQAALEHGQILFHWHC